MRIKFGLVLLAIIFAGPLSASSGVSIHTPDKPEAQFRNLFTILSDTGVVRTNRLPDGRRSGRVEAYLEQVFNNDLLAFDQDYAQMQKAVSAAAIVLKTRVRPRKQTQKNSGPLLSYYTRGKWS